MQARNWNLDKDYPYLVNWWKQHEFGIVPKKCLPPDGIIVEENNIPICAGGLYRCVDSNFSVMEWIVADKTANIKSIHKGLNLCITEIFKLAKKYNMELIYSMTANTSLHKRYTKYHNMKLVENNVKTFLMDLTKSYTDLEWISDDQQLKEQLKDK
jgi:hypothetical protein|tara:strand:+ start:450 stop:917 length:468 start_codon:yes stop_codon:yes gene_type:complete